MAVYILCRSGDWSVAAAAAATDAGSTTQLLEIGDGNMAFPDGRTASALDPLPSGADPSVIGAIVAAAMRSDTRVALVSSAVPATLVAALFATPLTKDCRKIVAVAAAQGPAALCLFDIADMLILSRAGVAHMLGLDRVPEAAAMVSRVRPLLMRPNQAAVVRFAGAGAAAIWADRTLTIAGSEADDEENAMARFCGIVAAAVDQGIGPERALEMALAPAVAIAPRIAVRWPFQLSLS